MRPLDVSVFDAIHREIDAVKEQARPVFGIAVTEAALPGSILAAPLSPQRQRAFVATTFAIPLRDQIVDSDGVTRTRNKIERTDALPRAYADRALEILVHPDDWATLRAEAGGTNPTKVLGYPVVHR